jgi:hypothetical protein
MAKAGTLPVGAWMDNVKTRGVKWNYERQEIVCTCRCHIVPGMRHARACCHEPKTELGKEALRNFKEDI